MKKRLICLLLVVCMVVALFSGLGVTAYAEGENYFTYTIAKNDNLFGICNWYKLTYNNDCKKVIMHLNGWTTETKLNVLTIGAVIKLPKDNAAVAEIVKTIPAATAAPTGAAAAATGTVVVANALIAPDTVSYYLIPYTLKAGDTLYAVCQNLGVNYNTYSEQINEINDISKVTRLAAGKSLLIPSSKAPATGSYYMIVAHKMVSGEYISSVCTSYGLDFDSNAATIRKLNNRDNLNVIKAGQTLLLPVLTTAGSGIGGGATGGTTVTPTSPASATATPEVPVSAAPTATVPPVPTVTVAPTIEPAADSTPDANGRYKLGVVTVTGGSISLSVGGSAASAAKPGDTVLITATPAEGYKLSKVTAYKTGDASISSVITTGAFKMPSYDASVTAEFVKISAVKTAAEAGGSVSVNKTLVEQGETVTIAITPNKGFVLDSLQVYATADSTKKVTVSGKTFVMPDYDVTVAVSFKTAYSITAVKDKDGNTMAFSVRGNASTVAYEGDTVIIVPRPVAGKAAESFTVTYADGSATVAVTNNVFVMPATAVKVEGVYSSSYKLAVKTASNGSIKLSVNGSGVSSASVGQKVDVIASPSKGYYLSKITMQTGEKTFAPSDISYSFTMTAANTTVTPTFAKLPSATVKLSSDTDKTKGAVSFLDNGSPFDTVAAGATVTVVAKPIADYYVKKVEAKIGSTSLAVASDNTFKVPATITGGEVINVTVTFEANTNSALTITSYVDGVVDTSNKAAVVEATVDGDPVGTKVFSGKTVKLAYKNGSEFGADYKLKDGYELDRVLVNSVEISGSSFTMPDTDSYVQIYFKSSGYPITVSTVEGYGSGKVLDGATQVSSAAKGATLKFAVEPEIGYKFKKLVAVGKESGTVSSIEDIAELASKTFTMLAEPVEVELYFTANEFAITEISSSNAKFKVNGKIVTKANTDAVVTIEPTEVAGYSVEEYLVTYIPEGSSAKKSVEISGNTFIMPAGAVSVQVVYSTSALPISVDVTGSGSVVVKDNDTKKLISSAKVGDRIYVQGVPANGYEVKSIAAYDVNGATLATTATAEKTFDMPNTAVTVEVEFEKKTNSMTLAYSLSSKDSTFKLQQSRKDVSAAEYGTTVNIVESVAKGEKITGYVISSKVTSGPKEFDDIVLTAETKSFTMPAGPCQVKALVEKIPYTVSKTGAANGSFTVTAASGSVSNAKFGEVVTVKCTPDLGYKVKSVKFAGTKATYDSTAAGVETWTFQMPAKDVSVSVVYELADLTITLPSDGSVTSKLKFIKLIPYEVADAQMGETVYLYGATPIKSFKLNGVTYMGNSFIMPGYAVTISEVKF